MKKEAKYNYIEVPKTNQARRVMWMGLSSLFITPFVGFFMTFLRRIIDPVSFNPSVKLPLGFIGVFLSLGLAVTTIVLFIKSYKLGEGSMVLWIGLIPAILVGGFWIFIIAGELLFPL